MALSQTDPPHVNFSNQKNEGKILHWPRPGFSVSLRDQVRGCRHPVVLRCLPGPGLPSPSAPRTSKPGSSIPILEASSWNALSPGPEKCFANPGQCCPRQSSRSLSCANRTVAKYYYKSLASSAKCVHACAYKHAYVFVSAFMYIAVCCKQKVKNSATT